MALDAKSDRIAELEELLESEEKPDIIQLLLAMSTGGILTYVGKAAIKGLVKRFCPAAAPLLPLIAPSPTRGEMGRGIRLGGGGRGGGPRERVQFRAGAEEGLEMVALPQNV